ncbi:unnamed protein product [Diamesa tonsa]
MAQNKEVDIFRDTYLRYLGYSNELGESFRPLVKRSFVNFTYVVAIGYVFADAADKTMKTYNKPIGGGTKKAIITCLYMLASVIIPGFTINRICWSVGKALKYSKMRNPAFKWAPTIIGLLSIPLIISPIDHGVDIFMNESYRKYIK